MILLNQLANNEVNVELVPSGTTPKWLFVFDLDDLNGKEIRTFYVPTYISSRYYTFIVDTTTNPMKTGEWVLNIYEKANTDNTDTTGLTPSYVSKVKIETTEPADNYHTPTLNDERID